jgi:hypothetical protein
MAGRISRILAHRHALPGRYRPERYWEARASELVRRYDSEPGDWERLGWMRGGVEEEFFVGWARELACTSVLVCGAGTGRQYSYLLDAGFSVAGFDIAPSLVAECKRRFPEVETTCCSVIDAHTHHEPADAVVSSAVLQHVPPHEIVDALAVLQLLARKAIVLRESTLFDSDPGYQWAHDYRALLAGWNEVHAETTDERPGVKVEVIAFRRAT